MGQSEEYLAAHRILVQKDEQIAQLQAQVEELQGDVSRLTIENEQLKAQPTALIDPVVDDLTKTTKKPRTSK